MLDFLKFGKKMPAWLALEAKDSSRSCQKSVDRTMKAIKKLMLSDDQAKSFFKVELNYQKDKPQNPKTPAANIQLQYY